MKKWPFEILRGSIRAQIIDLRQARVSLSNIPMGRELLFAWKISVMCVIAFPLVLPLLAVGGDFITAQFKQGSGAYLFFVISLFFPYLLFALAIFCIFLSIPLTYVGRQGSEQLGRMAWITATCSCLLLRYVFLNRHLIGTSVDGEALAPVSLAFALLSFLSSLLIWLTASFPPDWDWFVVILGYLQWFVLTPFAISKSRGSGIKEV